MQGAVLYRMTFRAPWRVVVALVLLVCLTNVVVFSMLVWAQPEAGVRVATALWPGVVLGTLAALAILAVPVPVVVDAEGIRLAWFFRLKWSDVTAARLRTYLGFRVLEIQRRRGLAWRPVLSFYQNLPEFLAEHAPEGNPLRALRTSSL